MRPRRFLAVVVAAVLASICAVPATALAAGVATYDGNDYATVQDAVDAIPADGSGRIVLTADCADNVVVPSGKTVELDLGTSVLSAADDTVSTIRVEGTLSVEGSGQVLRRHSSTDYRYGTIRVEGGTLSVNGGTITYDTTGTRGDGPAIYVGRDGSTVIINGGTITSSTRSYGTICAWNSDTSTTINGGTISSTHTAVGSIYGAVVINGGTITGDANEAVFCSKSVKINGGTINGGVMTRCFPSFTDPTTIITGGTITGNVTDRHTATDEGRRHVSTTRIAGSSVVVGGTVSAIDDDRNVLDASSYQQLSASAGTFASPSVARYLSEGKALLKRTGASYEVVDEADALDGALAIVRDNALGTEVYFADVDEAAAYAETLADSTLVRLCRVRFLCDGKELEVRVLEEGDALGELPANPDPDGRTFLGWYVDGRRVDASYEVSDDVDVVATWAGDDSAEPDDGGSPSVRPASGKGGLPKTGDATPAVPAVAALGAAIAALGILRRRA